VGPRTGLDRCVKSHHPTGNRSPDSPARSQSLYRLSYPGQRNFNIAATYFCPDGPLQRTATAFFFKQYFILIKKHPGFEPPAPLFWPKLRVNAKNVLAHSRTSLWYFHLYYTETDKHVSSTLQVFGYSRQQMSTISFNP